MSKINTKVMALGSVALFVTATAAMAGVPANPVLGLSGHTASNAYDADTGAGVYGLSYGIDGGGATFNANGDLTGLASRATCGATNATCKVLDGSGDGMLMYLVTDPNGKKHINQIVGQEDNVNGLFLGELFVEYNGGGAVAGGTNIDSMASKYIMKDTAELASAGSGFSMSAEWLRGDYQQTQPSGLTAALAGGGTGRDLDAVIDMNIGGVVSFHGDGLTSENGGVNNAGFLVDITSGTNANNTNQVDSNGNTFAQAQVLNPSETLAEYAADVAEQTQAMGVFHMRSQGGSAPYTTSNTNIGNSNYSLGTPTVTIGTGTLIFAATDGANVTYLHQAGFGFNGTADDGYTTDHAELRDFSYIRATKTAGVPGTGIGTFQDPMNGTLASTGTDGAFIVATSQQGSTPTYVAAPVALQNTTHAADYNSVLTATGQNDIFTTGAGGEFVGTGASNHDTDDLQAAWLAIFGVSAQ